MGEWLTDVFFGWIYDIFYTLQKSICYLLDFIRDIFCKLAGIETVKIDGGEEEILTRFITSPAIRNAFLGVLLVGVILLFVFVIIAIIKSEAADPQHKKTKGQILVKSLQSFVMLLKHKAQIEENKKFYGNTYDQRYLDYVCVEENGKIIYPDHMTKKFNELLKEHNPNSNPLCEFGLEKVRKNSHKDHSIAKNIEKTVKID